APARYERRPAPAWGGFPRKPGAGRSPPTTPQPPNNTEVRARTGPLRAKACRQPPHLRAARKAAASRRRAKDGLLERPQRAAAARKARPVWGSFQRKLGAGRSPPTTLRPERGTARYERRPFDSPHTCG